MSSRITATEAARGFSELLNRVRYRGEEFLIERGGVAVGRLSPVGPTKCTVADLAELLKAISAPDARFARDLETIRRKQPALPRSPWGR